MSRIFRYQESINKFYKTKSSLNLISDHNKIYLDEMSDDFDHLVSIFLVSILNNRCKKSKLKFHGYYIACGIDIAIYIAKITDKKYLFENVHGKNVIYNFLPELVSIMYQSLSGNIESLKLNIDLNETLKINKQCMLLLSKKLSDITNLFNNIKIHDQQIKKTDFINYNFKNEDLKKKYKKFKYIDKEELNNFVKKKYGSACQLSLIFGWLLGLGDEQKIKNLEDIGNDLGFIFKISFDFENIENDLINNDEYTLNLIINNGIKETIEQFIMCKSRFIEGLLSLDIWSTTIKEILDLIEKNIDNYLNETDIDEIYSFSDFSS